MILVIILCLLFVNMFVGIVIQTYNLEKDFLNFNTLLTEEQRSWIQVQIMTYGVSPVPLVTTNSRFCLRNVCIRIAKSRVFENFIMACILVNTVVLGLIWFDEPPATKAIVEVCNYFFTAVFTIEAIIKLIALKKTYFKESWNIFDFTIVVFTLLILLLKVA